MASSDRTSALRITPAQIALTGGLQTAIPSIVRLTGADLPREGGTRYEEGALRGGGGGPVSLVTYLMRGRVISTGLKAYWEAVGAPDLTGTGSGHFGDIDQIVVLGTL